MTKRKTNARKQPKNKSKVGTRAQPRTVERVVYRDRPAQSKPNSFLGNLGALAGNGLSKFLGMGAYKISRNSVFDEITKGQVPFMHSSSETVIFRHREYITDISSSVGFATQTYDINPGLNASFPFLSSIARNFQQYELKGLVYEFRSTSADALNSTNTALGSVIMASQYDVNDAAFTDKTTMLNEMWSASAKPSETFILPIECDPSQNPLPLLYVRGATPSTGDLRLYDHAKLTVATYGSQAVAVIGELWATYEVVLRKPVMTSFDDQYDQSARYSLPSHTAATMFAAPVKIYDSLGLTFTATTITIPKGNKGIFLLYLNSKGASTAVVSPSAVCTGGCQNYNIFDGVNYSTNTGTTSTNFLLVFAFKIVDPQQTSVITWSSGTLPSSNTGGNLLIAQIDGSLI